MKQRGENTIGYGKTKDAVVAGFKAGLTMTEIAKKHGISRAAVNNCAYRNGIKFPYVKLAHPYGDIKHKVMLAAEQGMTRKQIAKAYGFNHISIRKIDSEYKLNIPKA